MVAGSLGTYAIVAWLGLGSAGAIAPEQQGWWTSLNGASLPMVGKSSPTSPDVPAQGLLVEGGLPGSPVAFSALTYTLPSGATASTLTLTIAPKSATTPDATLELCPLIDPVFKPVQGGPSSGAPPYNCAHSVSAVPNAKASSYQFEISTLVSNGDLAVAVLATSPLDRVVFSQPDDGSLAVQLSTGGAAPQSGSSLPVGASPSSASGISSFGSTAIPTFGSSEYGTVPSFSPVPSTVAHAAAPASPAPTDSSSRPYAAIPTFKEVTDNASPTVVAVVLAGLSGGAALWFSTGRRRLEEEEELTPT